MSSINKDFERMMLREVRPDVIKNISVEARKNMWTYRYGKRGETCSWDFGISDCKQFPDGIYYSGISAETAWGARAMGWYRLLETMKVELK